MAKKFLDGIADYILREHSRQIDDLVVIMPGRRAFVYLKQILGKKLNHSGWLPEMLTIEDLAQRISGLMPADQINLLFSLYDVYKEVSDEPVEFADFLSWGPVALSDFNEIDSHLAPADKLFTYLHEARVLETWNPGADSLTDFQLRYLEFWRMLGTLYDRFTAACLRNGEAYDGLILREAASVKQLPAWLDKRPVIVAGFNAYTPAEEAIIKLLLDYSGIEFIDADRYYLDNQAQEAGRYIRKRKEKLKQEAFSLVSGSMVEYKEITVTGTPGDVLQSRLAGSIAGKIKEKANPESFAIVLADEAMLLPVLNSLPAGVPVNVTMGFPLSASPVYRLMKDLLVLQEYLTPDGHFHHRSLTALLSNTFIRQLDSSGQASVFNKINSYIVRNNKIRLSLEELKMIAGEESAGWIDALEPLMTKNENLVQLCLTLIEKLKTENAGSDKDPLLRDQLYHLNLVLVQLRDAGAVNLNNITPRLFSKLLDQLVRQYRLPFQGEPLEGIQVMGFLESRLLDFDHVVLAGMNEGVIPSGKTVPSFIPWDIRKSFGLFTYRDKDAIYAYHFYRLIQRAGKVDLIYSTNKDVTGGGEKSRFITQMLVEFPESGASAVIREKLLSLPPPPANLITTSITRTPEVQQLTTELFQRGISPSAFINYLQCPQDFFFSTLLGVRDDDRVEEEIESSTMGSLIHDALLELYKPVVGKVPQLPEERAVDHEIEISFRKKFTPYDLSKGKNHLALHMAKKYVQRLLQEERRYYSQRQLPVITRLEHKLQYTCMVQDHEVKFKGFADRIETGSGGTRVIDYKTGQVESRELEFDQISELFSDNRKSKALQLTWYAWLYSKENPGEHMQAGIISLRNLSSFLMPLKYRNQEKLDQDFFVEFETVLFSIISEMASPANVFPHREDAVYCTFCN